MMRVLMVFLMSQHSLLFCDTRSVVRKDSYHSLPVMQFCFGFPWPDSGLVEDCCLTPFLVAIGMNWDIVEQDHQFV